MRVIGSATTTSCVITFQGSWATAHSACHISPSNAAAAGSGVGAYVSLPSTTSFTINGTALANTNFTYWCE
jgi:hypothetical protein